MNTSIVIIYVLLAICFVFASAIMMFVILRLEEYDRKIEDQDHKIENIRQGGELTTKRLNVIETSINVTQTK